MHESRREPEISHRRAYVDAARLADPDAEEILPGQDQDLRGGLARLPATLVDGRALLESVNIRRGHRREALPDHLP